MAVVVAADAVVKRFGAVTALDGATLEVGRGVTGLVGANGAGKTTLLGLVLGLSRPDEGTIRGPRPRPRCGPGRRCAPSSATRPSTTTSRPTCAPSTSWPTSPRSTACPTATPSARASDALWQVGLGEERFRAARHDVDRPEAAGEAGRRARPRPAADPARRADRRPRPGAARRHAHAHPAHRHRVRHRRAAVVAPARRGGAGLRRRRHPRRRPGAGRPARSTSCGPASAAGTSRSSRATSSSLPRLEAAGATVTTTGVRLRVEDIASADPVRDAVAGLGLALVRLRAAAALARGRVPRGRRVRRRDEPSSRMSRAPASSTAGYRPYDGPPPRRRRRRPQPRAVHRAAGHGHQAARPAQGPARSRPRSSPSCPRIVFIGVAALIDDDRVPARLHPDLRRVLRLHRLGAHRVRRLRGARGAVPGPPHRHARALPRLAAHPRRRYLAVEGGRGAGPARHRHPRTAAADAGRLRAAGPRPRRARSTCSTCSARSWPPARSWPASTPRCRSACRASPTARRSPSGAVLLLLLGDRRDHRRAGERRRRARVAVRLQPRASPFELVQRIYGEPGDAARDRHDRCCGRATSAGSCSASASMWWRYRRIVVTR